MKNNYFHESCNTMLGTWHSQHPRKVQMARYATACARTTAFQMAATRQVERNFGIAVLNPSFWEVFGNLVSVMQLIFLGVWPRILNLNGCAVAVRVQEKMAELTTNEKVAAAFKMAGYTCRSFHGARNYAGTPFSKATPNDDCAPWTAGTPASSINCNANSYGHYAPLCACK